MWLVRSVVAAVVATAALFAGTAPAWAQPTNDDFDSATVVTEPLPFTDSVATADATTAADDPQCLGNGHTVWYTYTPGADGWVNANTFGSNYDTTLSVYTGARGALTQVTCNDDAEGLQSSVTWEAQAGTTYYLMAGTFFESPGGNLALTVQESAPPPPPAEPPTVDVTVDPIGRVDLRTGAARVSGSLTCGDGGLEGLGGDLRQPIGRFTISGFFSIYEGLSCDGALQHWTAEVTGENGKFAAGRAAVKVSVFVCNDEGICADDFEDRSIRLRR